MSKANSEFKVQEEVGFLRSPRICDYLLLVWGYFWAIDSAMGVLAGRGWFWQPLVRQWWQWVAEKPAGQRCSC